MKGIYADRMSASLTAFLLAAPLLTTLATGGLQAAESKGPFHVEVLAFTQPGVSDDSTRAATWWNDSVAMLPCHAVQLRDGVGAEIAFEGDTRCIRTPGAYTTLTGFSAISTTALATQAGKMKRNGYNLLLSRSWHQASATLSPVLLQGGASTDTRQELRGTLTLTESERWLEVTLEFVLTRMDGEMPQYVTLKEARKFQAGELQYFDHPLFGMMVQVSTDTPASTPNARPKKPL